MIQRASVTDILRNFSDYINRVAYRGERFLLIRGGAAVAELSPVPSGRSLGDLTDLLASLPRLGADDADSLGADLDLARTQLDTLEPGNPWDS
jgi:antitoxin (DNA-binding transcriptional repressor) of toxin-antitoxin stability system